MLKLLCLLNYFLFLILTLQLILQQITISMDAPHETFTYAQRSHSSLVHSVGKWCTLGLEGLSVSQVLHRCFLILEAGRGVSKQREGTHRML